MPGKGYLRGRVILKINPPPLSCIFVPKGNNLLSKVGGVTLSKMIQCIENRVKVLVPMLVIFLGLLKDDLQKE